MCFQRPKVDNTIQKAQLADAEAARVKEAEREQRIVAGTEAINEQFSIFDDTFYSDRKDKYLDFYQPQLDDQFGKAKDDLTFSLARAGTLNSSMAGQKQADLLKSYGTESAGLLSQAEGEISSQKSRLQSEKSALTSQLNATGNADQVSNEALSRSQNLFTEQPTYGTLGNLFSGVANGIGSYNQGVDAGNQSNAYFGSAASARSGSSRTVN